jgi:hypothetical protein
LLQVALELRDRLVCGFAMRHVEPKEAKRFELAPQLGERESGL